MPLEEDRAMATYNMHKIWYSGCVFLSYAISSQR